ncbi:Pkinase-domain-containing protein [Dissoconium aciculare CBS 342.82]|uniref:non-specific serine/threonine protein kinase n=1 Tax=Dissoconium aciculare CBS 342.82 TaxID=1314786 RepID=A0A6J3MC71_9PEZI|nr:Pkinase-domain-containing protein [Dissoconium aciculare CBS 342.82]KAF1825610.1 Pkinase-domain-containing protein [Dissoconium aciculare CBS 342.82]
MSADLSLSQSLGGLRIANPDDETASSSPASSPPPPAMTARRPSNDQRQYEQQRLSESSASAFTSDGAAAQLHRPTLQPSQQSTYGVPSRHGSVQHSSSRPVSSVHAQQNAPLGAGVMGPGTYRYGGEGGLPDGNLGGLSRSTSRSTRQPSSNTQAWDQSRGYRQASIPGSTPAVSQYPQRRNSRRGRAASDTIGVPDTTEKSHALPNSAEEWRDRGAAVKTVRETDANGQPQTRVVKKGVKDFNFGRTLGEGSYSTVLAATDRQNNKEYAIKVLDKRHIIKEKKVKYVNIERDTLNRLTEHPGIVRLYYTFQDERSLYFVLDLATGGELLGVLKKLGSFDIDCTRFYAAEILDSIAYMHSRGIIHRDLKPENVLLDRDMHVKITDFGTAKILRDPRPPGVDGRAASSQDLADGAETDRAISFVGTAEYVSPELLRDKNACKASDLWAFGCIIYQLLAGRPPFKAANEYLTFQKILALDYSFPDGFPEVARDLVERLLVLEPTSRLPMEHVKNHRFFDGVQWGKTLWRQKPPRLSPHVPPPREPISLNGPSASAASAAHAALTNAHNASNAASAPPRRPQLQTVTELAPPSQLDIDWSPVLTNNNERILKLGNLMVSQGAPPGSPDAPTQSEKSGFARLFSAAAASKRKERLVLITTCARLVVTAAGGNEKKAKMELPLAAHIVSCRSLVITNNSHQRDKHYVFEDPRATTSDPAGSRYSTQEWLDAIEQAREVALATSLSSAGGSSSTSAGGNPFPSSAHNEYDEGGGGSGDGGGNGNSAVAGAFATGRKRFSKRHSKSGLAAVF